MGNENQSYNQECYLYFYYILNVSCKIDQTKCYTYNNI